MGSSDNRAGAADRRLERQRADGPPPPLRDRRLLVCAALGAALLTLGGAGGLALGSPRRRNVRGPPLLAGAVTAFALERNRFSTSVQLLQNLQPDPLGAAGLLAVQLTVVGLGSVWGAWSPLADPRAPGRVVAAVVLGYLGGISALVVRLH